MSYFEEVKQTTTPKEICTELDCLTTISLNVSDYCNKSCAYCPHGQGYEPELNSMMSTGTARKIRDRLQELKDKNVMPRLTISGMGEPFLNSDLEEILIILKDFHPIILTNGTVQPTWAKELPVIISVHDKKEEAELRAAWPNARFRDHDPESLGFELHVTNRNDYKGDFIIYTGTCYCPFYKMVIDWDGSYLKCAEDWLRESKAMYHDVYHESIEDWFCHRLTELKRVMVKFGRECEPTCCHCNIEGTMMGGEAYDWYTKHCKG